MCNCKIYTRVYFWQNFSKNSRCNQKSILIPGDWKKKLFCTSKLVTWCVHRQCPKSEAMRETCKAKQLSGIRNFSILWLEICTCPVLVEWIFLSLIVVLRLQGGLGALLIHIRLMFYLFLSVNLIIIYHLFPHFVSFVQLASLKATPFWCRKNANLSTFTETKHVCLPNNCGRWHRKTAADSTWIYTT